MGNPLKFPQYIYPRLYYEVTDEMIEEARKFAKSKLVKDERAHCSTTKHWQWLVAKNNKQIKQTLFENLKLYLEKECSNWAECLAKASKELSKLEKEKSLL